MKQVILILGMHRSGTSALTRVMNLLGAGLPIRLLGQNTSNMRGHWESEPMIAEHDAILAGLGSDWKDWRALNWPRKGSRKDKDLRESFVQRLADDFSEDDAVIVIKEPRICRFSDPYIKTLEADGLSVYPVIMVRNPLEVAASLHARDGIEKLDALYLWLTHMLGAELASRGRPRSFLYYDDFIGEPLESLKGLSADMKRAGLSFPFQVADVKRQIEDYVSPQLKRQSIASEATALDPFSQGWVNEAFGAFRVLCENGGSKQALSKLDKVRTSYFAAIEPLHHALSIERTRLETEFSHALSKAVSEHEIAVEALQNSHQESWQAREAEHEKSWKAREAEHEKSWQAREAEHEKSWKGREIEHETNWKARESEHEENLRIQQEEFEARLTSQRETHEQAWAARDKEHEDLVKSLMASHEAEMANLESQISNLELEREAIETQAAQHMNVMRDEFGDILRGAEANAETAGAEAQSLRNELNAVLNSTSWKLTGGLRRIMNLLKGVKSKDATPRIHSENPAPRLDYKSEP